MDADTDAAAVFAACTAALAEPGQPAPIYTALSRAAQALVGHRLCTAMILDLDAGEAGEAARTWSNQPEAYPVGGRKPLGRMTGWGRHVIEGRQPWLGRTAQDIRWAFFDHELIVSLGCGAAINVPVLYDGRILGTLNILDAEHAYDEAAVARVAPLGAFLVGPFLEDIARGGPKPG